MHLGFDAVFGYSVSTAIMQVCSLEEMDVAYFEKPLPKYDFPGLKQVLDALGCPVSTGDLQMAMQRPDVARQPRYTSAQHPEHRWRIGDDAHL